MAQVTIYTSNHCGYCVMAKRLLARRGIVPHEISVDDDESLRSELIRRTGQRTLPQIFIAGQHIGGYDHLAALDRNGQLEAMA